jgi:hypothetical protein
MNCVECNHPAEKHNSAGCVFDIGDFKLCACKRDKFSAPLSRWIVTAQAFPLNYNLPQAYIVEAETSEDAIELMKQQLGDYAVVISSYTGLPDKRSLYKYAVRPYDLPKIQGRVIGMA